MAASPIEYRSAGAIDQYEMHEPIGDGSYSRVYRGIFKETRKEVALKKLLVEAETVQELPKEAIREIEILQKLKHPNVIDFKGILHSSGPDLDKPDGNQIKKGIYLVFEYMEHDVFGLLQVAEKKYNSSQIKCYMKQLLLGLEYCHGMNVLHRDIKDHNILINNEGILKIADFGLAKEVSDICGDVIHTNMVVTLWYRSPELLLGASHYGTAVDIWSAGCLFAEFLNNGEHIFRGEDEKGVLEDICKLRGSLDETNFPGVSKLPRYSEFNLLGQVGSRLREVHSEFGTDALDLLDRILALNPCERISAADALKADYFFTDPLPCDPTSFKPTSSTHYVRGDSDEDEDRDEDEYEEDDQAFVSPQWTPLQETDHGSESNTSP